MNFDFGKVLGRSWQIVWKHKVLWIFGMFASCGRGNGGGNSSGSNNYPASGDPYSGDPFSNEMAEQMFEFMDSTMKWFIDNPGIIVALIVFGLILWLIQIFLATVGGIGLIRGAYHAEMGMEKIIFTDLFRESLRYFWRTIGLGLTIFLPIMIVFIGIFLAFFFALESSSTPSGSNAFAGVFLLFIIGFCCLLIPFMIVLGIYYTQALRALIVEDLGIFASLSRGWEVLRKNFWELLIIAVILFVINLVIGVLILIPIYVSVFPLMFNMIQGGINSWQPFIIVGVILVLYSPIAWVLSGFLLAYSETAWTLTYLQLGKPKENNAPILLEPNA